MNLYKRTRLVSSLLYKNVGLDEGKTNGGGVNVIGYLTSELGVGEGARSSIKCLKAMRMDCSLINVTKHSYSRQKDFTFSEFVQINPYFIIISNYCC